MSPNRTVGVRFETEQKADFILKSLLPAGWLPRKQDPDFHVDYVVEVVESGELTGLNFGVQLKGVQPRKGKPVRFKYSLKVKHLSYYLDKATIPIFLILVNVVNGKAYWCFTQKYARECIDPNELKKRNTVSIPFVEGDCMDRPQDFKQSVLDATEYMKKLYPGSISAAVEAQVAKLQEIDPRVDVNISFRDGHQHVALSAKHQFEFKTTVVGQNASELKQALENFVERGDKLKVQASALKFEGAPLLSHFFPGSDDDYVTLQYAREVPGSLQMFEGGSEPIFLFQIDANFKCGTKFATFEGGPTNSALLLKTTISVESAIRSEPHDLRIFLIPDKWIDQPLQELAYFDLIHRFLGNLNEGRPTVLKFHVLGNYLFSSQLDSSGIGNVAEMFEMLNLIQKARFIARKFKLNPALPKPSSIKSKQLKTIDDIYELLHGRQTRSPIPHFKQKLMIIGPGPKAGLTSKEIFQVVAPKHVFEFFGSEVTLGPIHHFVTETILESATTLPDGDTELLIAGTAESEWVMQLDKDRAAHIFP
ncbi:MAG: hypothetical protein JWR26_2562 [Pedosphaera sp.]|nr:hypothetical protein [Pedosphaera sp.]